MIISNSSWDRYRKTQAAIRRTAARKFEAYLNTHEWQTPEGRKAALDYAAALVESYGGSAAAAACEMYDAISAASGLYLPPAEPAELSSYGEVAKTVNGIMKESEKTEYIASGVERQVKQADADTMLHNAARDSAEWAWIPQGKTCAFCLTLASRGWQHASEKILKGGHAEHIHANCDCEFSVRFDGKSSVEGYDPEKLREEYYAHGGDISAWQRDLDAEEREEINAGKHGGYAEKKSLIDTGQNAKLIKKAIQEQANESKSSVLVNAIISNHEGLREITPRDMKSLLENAGYTVEPLGSKSKHVPNVPFEEGGGFRVRFGGDGYLQYHPAGGYHTIPYWKINNGERGKHWYDTDGNERFFGKGHL